MGEAIISRRGGGSSKIWCFDIPYLSLPIQKETLFDDDHVIYKNILEYKDKLYTVINIQNISQFQLTSLTLDFEIISVIQNMNNQMGFNFISIDNTNERFIYIYDVSNTRRIHIADIKNNENITSSDFEQFTLYAPPNSAPYHIGDNIFLDNTSYSNMVIDHLEVSGNINRVKNQTLLYTPNGGFVDNNELIMSIKEKNNDSRYLAYIDVLSPEIVITKMISIPTSIGLDKNNHLQYVKDDNYIYLLLSDYRILVVSRLSREIVKIGPDIREGSNIYDMKPYFIGNSLINGELLIGGFFGIKIIDLESLTIKSQRNIIPVLHKQGYGEPFVRLANTSNFTLGGSPITYLNSDKTILATRMYNYLINSNYNFRGQYSQLKSPLYY